VAKSFTLFILVGWIFIHLIPINVEAREVTQEEWRVLKKAEQLYYENKMQGIVALLKPFAQHTIPHEAVFSYLSMALIEQGRDNEAYALLEQATKTYSKDYVLQYNFAITAMRLEKFQEAIFAFTIARKIQEERGGDTSQIIYYIATAHYILEHYDKAIELIVPLINNKDPMNHQWIQLAVNCYLMKNAWENAEHVLSQWIDFVPDNKSSWQMLGDVLVKQEKYQKAAGAYEIANLLGNKNISPGNLFSIYRYLYVHSEASRWAEDPVLKKTHWLEHAEELYQAADFTKALQVLDQEPTSYINPQALILRGKSHLALGNTDEAVVTWLRCMDLPLPEDENLRQARQQRDELTAAALMLAGETCWLQKKWLKARDIFRKLSYLPGYEGAGNSLASTMQYLLDNEP
jgi:tetratricopeptide (TPR) repeat protein